MDKNFTVEEEMEDYRRYKTCKNWNKFCENHGVWCIKCASYEFDENLWESYED